MPADQIDAVTAWVTRLVAELDLPAHIVDTALVLDLARDAAHSVARPAAPVTTFVLGLAAGRAGGSVEDIDAVAERISAILEAYPTDTGGSQ